MSELKNWFRGNSEKRNLASTSNYWHNSKRKTRVKSTAIWSSSPRVNEKKSYQKRREQDELEIQSGSAFSNTVFSLFKDIQCCSFAVQLLVVIKVTEHLCAWINGCKHNIESYTASTCSIGSVIEHIQALVQCLKVVDGQLKNSTDVKQDKTFKSKPNSPGNVHINSEKDIQEMRSTKRKASKMKQDENYWRTNSCDNGEVVQSGRKKRPAVNVPNESILRNSKVPSTEVLHYEEGVQSDEKSNTLVAGPRRSNRVRKPTALMAELIGNNIHRSHGNHLKSCMMYNMYKEDSLEDGLRPPKKTISNLKHYNNLSVFNPADHQEEVDLDQDLRNSEAVSEETMKDEANSKASSLVKDIYKCPETKKTEQVISRSSIHDNDGKQKSKLDLTRKCDFCEKLFKSVFLLRKHHLTAHRKVTVYQCPYCHYVDQTAQLLSFHVSQKHSHEIQLEPNQVVAAEQLVDAERYPGFYPKREAHKCPHCAYTNPNRTYLRAHVMQQHTGERPFLCHYCGKGFTMSKHLTRHKEAIHEKGMFPCVKCDFQTHTAHLLRVHVSKWHTSTRPTFSCPLCGTVVKNKSSLTIHLRSHKNQRPFKCLTCDKSFTSSSILAAHRRRHKDPTEKCTYCGKMFFNQSKLKLHLNIHTGERNFKCPACKYAAYSKDNLRKHCLSVHNMEYPPCNPAWYVKNRMQSANIECDNALEKLNPTTAAVIIRNGMVNELKTDAKKDAEVDDAIQAVEAFTVTRESSNGEGQEEVLMVPFQKVTEEGETEIFMLEVPKHGDTVYIEYCLGEETAADYQIVAVKQEQEIPDKTSVFINLQK